MGDLFGVKIVPNNNIQKDEAYLVSGAKMTHTENLTTGDIKKITAFIDAIKLEKLTPPQKGDKWTKD